MPSQGGGQGTVCAEVCVDVLGYATGDGDVDQER